VVKDGDQPNASQVLKFLVYSPGGLLLSEFLFGDKSVRYPLQLSYSPNLCYISLELGGICRYVVDTEKQCTYSYQLPILAGGSRGRMGLSMPSDGSLQLYAWSQDWLA
ncbi:hypothetical protein HDU91_002079, partial [Kappamyces sp. JEL0680]